MLVDVKKPGGSLAKKCFVISPIGAENSDTRRHADVVYNCIIAPACERGAEGGWPYAPERGDHKAAPGKITDQIYEDILEADLIIVVLTGSNPNVYYELAIAQSAAKPVILLMEKGYDAPFDIKDQRIIYYDFDPQRIFDRTYVKQLRSAILSLESRRSRPVVPFAPDLAPLGDPMQAIYQRASEAEEDTVRLINNAEKFVYLTGYTLAGWTMNSDFIAALESRSKLLSEGLRVMLVAPDNPALRPAMKSEHIFQSTQNSAEKSQAVWQTTLGKIDLALPDGKTGPAPQLRISRDQSINYQMMISEKEAIVVPYLTSRDTLRSPYIYAREDSFYHEALVEEFEFVWGASTKFDLIAPSVEQVEPGVAVGEVSKPKASAKKKV